MARVVLITGAQTLLAQAFGPDSPLDVGVATGEVQHGDTVIAHAAPLCQHGGSEPAGPFAGLPFVKRYGSRPDASWRSRRSATTTRSS